RGADLTPLKRRQHRPMAKWLAWEEPRAVRDLVHVETFFARKLGGLIHARTRVPGRLGKATSRTPSMCVDEKSDGGHSTCETTEQGEATLGGNRGEKGLQPVLCREACLD